MKLLLTSGGVTNPTIHAALVELLGKPIAECHALIVPTAALVVLGVVLPTPLATLIRHGAANLLP